MKPVNDNLPNIWPNCSHNTSCPRDAKEMPGHRHRNKDGTLRAKSGATHVETLENDLGEFTRQPDTVHLSSLRKQTGKKGVNAVKKAVKDQEGPPCKRIDMKA